MKRDTYNQDFPTLMDRLTAPVYATPKKILSALVYNGATCTALSYIDGVFDMATATGAPQLSVLWRLRGVLKRGYKR